jgi:hypothetical protein
MKPVRPLKNYSFSCFANLAKEDLDVRNKRLLDKKKVRNLRRSDLKKWVAEANQRDYSKVARAETNSSETALVRSSL